MQGPSPVHMEVQCRAHLQFAWRSSAGPISSSHGGPVQGPSPQSGARHTVQLVVASQSSIIEVPGLKDEVSTLLVCIQAGH